MLLGHLEENLDAPAFSEDADYLLVGQIDFRRQADQPAVFISVTNEYQLAQQPPGERDQRTSLDLGSAPAFFQPAVDPHQSQ